MADLFTGVMFQQKPIKQNARQHVMYNATGQYDVNVLAYQTEWHVIQ